jgi:hypothetical protein
VFLADSDSLVLKEAEQMVAGGRAAKNAGPELCFYVLIGAGGTARLEQALDILDTAQGRVRDSTMLYLRGLIGSL